MASARGSRVEAELRELVQGGKRTRLLHTKIGFPLRACARQPDTLDTCTPDLLDRLVLLATGLESVTINSSLGQETAAWARCKTVVGGFFEGLGWWTGKSVLGHRSRGAP